MLCLMARRYLAADNGWSSHTGPAGAALRRALARHLAACAACRAEQETLGQLVTLLAEAAPLIRLDGGQFADRLMATIGARRRASAEEPSRGPDPFAWSGFRPASALPALCLMLAAGVMALYLSGQAIPGSATRLAATASPVTQVDDYHDSLKPPREVPFSVEEDLVGTRRGTIPLTTYVLEPAPKEAPIVLASF